MKLGNPPAAISLILSVSMPLAFAQTADQRKDNAPIYRVTVVERTVKAVNYHYRSEPTRIDFRGTVLLPKAKGEAIVESQKGHTEIDAKLEGLSSPQRFSGEYLTYVLWAITPEGRPHNIGELLADSSDKARIHVTTDLQAFALIVTAEPHSAVRQPSDVVVLENEIRPDTLGIIKPVEAKYELLPRGEYTLREPNQLSAAVANAPKVSMHEYEAVMQLYQAQNAVAIADRADAERYAPDTLARAKQMLSEAQQMHDHKGDFRKVVQYSREAAQTAEDARAIAVARDQAEQLRLANVELSKAKAELSSAQQDNRQALVAEQRVQAQADIARAQAEQERVEAQAAIAARNRAESDAIAARERAAEAQSQAQVASARAAQDQQRSDFTRKREARTRLLEDLKGAIPTLDTGRGLVATVPDDGFRGTAVQGSYSDQVARLAAVLSVHPGLRVSVEGYSGDPGKEAFTQERAAAVRQVLLANGLSANVVSATGYGDSRPLGPNTTAQGRKSNSRVEIVISGEPIGNLPLWEKGSNLTSSTQTIGRP
jgi:outer membrane protein OmpA-like peptidoglycan-associated protein